METGNQSRCTAFEDSRRIASGPLGEVGPEAKAAYDRGGRVLVFDDETGESIELDYRGSAADFGSARRAEAPRGQGPRGWASSPAR